jgi:alanine dehydrogenase
MTRILTRADVASVITRHDCLVAVEQAFRAYGEGRMEPPKSMGLHAEAGTFHIKAAIGDLFAVKINANFPGNPAALGLPTVQGVILLMDLHQGTPLAVLDSALITTLRTAAATALAANYLARKDAATVAIIGCGTQGRASLEALAGVRTIESAYAFDADGKAAERLAREMTGTIAVRAVPSIADAVAHADIVVTCTPSKSPFLDAAHLRKGMFIAAVGADNPQKQELTPALLRRARVVADIVEQAATMGDLHHALEAGVMTREDVHGELADVLCGRAASRQNDEEIFVFDSTGTALQDVAVSAMVYARALDRGAGMDIAFG